LYTKVLPQWHSIPPKGWEPLAEWLSSQPEKNWLPELVIERLCKQRPYHHGNLKQELLNTALTLISESGPQGFTLREVARRAGVSHNAPYRHFRDKDDLLAAVAAEGFARLTSAMKRSAARGKTPLERLRLCGRGYIQFALPQHFLVMFDLPAQRGGA
jgi:AcrR family transcriptional regulator